MDELHELARRAYPFAELSRAQLENVLDMLAGRYPSDEFAELRPRIVWDRTAGTVRGRTGARRLAVTNAGTIPDRGLFGVFLVDGGGRVGELDEEMVYEAREGQTFLLGASTWRIEEITRDRVLVSPAPGVPGVAPFWKGEGVGRPAELGEKIGRAARELSRSPMTRDRAARGATTGSTRGPRGTSSRSCASRNPRRGSSRRTGRSSSSAFATRSATGASASSRRSAAACTRPGRWRCARDCATSLDLDVQSLWSDDGIALHFPDADVPPPLADLDARAGRDRGSPARRARAVGALRGALPRERGACAAHPAPPARPAHAALAAAAEGAEPPPGRPPLSAVPDRARDVPRVPPGRLRPAGAARASCAASRRARSPWSRSRPRRRRRSPRRSSSSTSRRTCTRTTRRPRSGVRRRSPSTATSCASSWASRSSASCSTSARSSRSRRRSDRRRGTSTSCTTCSAAPGRSSTASTTAGSRRRSCASAARFACASASSSSSSRSRTPGSSATRSASCRPAACRRCSSSRSSARLRACSGATRRRTGRSRRPRWPTRFGLERRVIDAELAALERDDELVRGELRPGGIGARVVRSGRPAPDPSRDARGAAAGGRAGRAGGVRPLSPCLARHRAAPGLREALVPLQGVALPAALWESDVLPRRVLGVPAGGSRRALRFGRGRLGRRRARPRRRLLP